MGFNDGAGMINHGIGLLHEPKLSESLAFTGMERDPAVGTCAICGRPLSQDGRCLRCLIGLGFLGGSQEPGKLETRRQLTPGPLKYDHFEVEVGADGFPVELGAGAMAVTYRARDTVLNSAVALKVIDRSAAENPGVRSRFLREARAAAQIHHPNVAQVSHYGEQNGECFYVMELVEGDTLEARIRREGPMPLSLALEITEQAARALAAAEACGVVHRDIKPSNIMLESDPSGALVVKVIDYGVAKVLAPQAGAGAEQTQAGFIGTPAFASPEQFAENGKSRIDTRSDIYSFGVTLWFLLCGRTAICRAHSTRSCGKTGGGTPARAAEECSRAGACDCAVAVDVSCRSSEASANSARTAISNPPLLHKIQHGSAVTSKAIHRSGRGSNCSCRGDGNQHLALPTRAIFR